MRCDDFGTAGLPANTQLEAWQSWYGNVFDTTALESDNRSFIAQSRAWNLGGFALNQVTAPGLSVVRTKTLIRREPVDHWAITLSKRCVTHVDCGTHSLAAPAGVPFVVSLGQEMRNRRESDDRIQLYLSRDAFYNVASLLDATCMTALETAGGRLLADYMRLLLRNVPTMDDNEAIRLLDATQAMIAACLAPSAQRIAEARPVINVTLMEKVRQSVRRHLRSAALGPDLICRDAATSRSQLYRLLENEGGVGRYIRKVRLSEAFSLLCKSSQNSTISAIAEALCFADSSSFTRAFRREFGVSPSDVRMAAQTGIGPIAAVRDDFEIVSFASLLRGH